MSVEAVNRADRTVNSHSQMNTELVASFQEPDIVTSAQFDLRERPQDDEGRGRRTANKDASREVLLAGLSVPKGASPFSNPNCGGCNWW